MANTKSFQFTQNAPEMQTKWVYFENIRTFWNRVLSIYICNTYHKVLGAWNLEKSEIVALLNAEYYIMYPRPIYCLIAHMQSKHAQVLFSYYQEHTLITKL